MDVPATPDPGATAPADPPGPPAGAPDGGMIGRYRLLRQLGEGGWGAVYLAEQSEPVRRRVALKVIKLGMDTRSVLARFEAERQALAMMDHPNIARVLDGGATLSGRPYFVMELVRGLRITEYCDGHRLAPAARLRLFLQVCAAVQHAHEKGIIHRDLKPSNILVAGEGAEAAAKVIDFGIAKSVHGRLAEATVHTTFEQAIGTPAYMSPEQAGSGGLDLDTRSDVYALGVVLYELLAGRPPFDPAELERAGPDGMRRILREEDPPPPSRAAAADADAGGGAAAARGVTPGRLPALLRGELDWIVLKALEKRRERRYASAAALAEDISRHLADEPVLARPAGRAYLVGKFIARHRVAVTAAAAVALALVAGTVVSLRQAREARLAEQGTRAAQQRSDELLDFMTGGLRDSLAKEQSLGVLVKVGEKARGYFDSLESGQLSDSTLVRHARILRQLGELYLKSGKYPDAVRILEDSLGRSEAVLRRRPDDPAALFELGQAEGFLGQTYRRAGNRKLALEWLERYRGTGRRQWELNPKSQQALTEMFSGIQGLAVHKRDAGDLRGALEDFTTLRSALRAAELTSGKPAEIRQMLMVLESWLGEIADDMGDLRGALDHYAAASESLEELVRSEPRDNQWRYQLARNLARQGALWAVTGELPRARASVERGLELMMPLTALDPRNQEWRRTSFRLQRHRNGLDLVGVVPPAPAALASAGTVDSELEAALKSASDPTLALILSAMRRFQAEALRSTDRGRADQLISSAVSLAEKHLEGDGNKEARREAAQARASAALIARDGGDASRARAHAQRVLEIVKDSAPELRHWTLLEAEMRARIVLEEAGEAANLKEFLSGKGYKATSSP